jgi:hypothetical protein
MVALISCDAKSWNHESIITNCIHQLRNIARNRCIKEHTHENHTKSGFYAIMDKPLDLKNIQRKRSQQVDGRRYDNNVKDVVHKIVSRNDNINEGNWLKSFKDTNLSSNVTSTRLFSLSWIDRTMSRIVSIFTWFAISQSLINMLKSSKDEIATEVCHFLSY